MKEIKVRKTTVHKEIKVIRTIQNPNRQDQLRIVGVSKMGPSYTFILNGRNRISLFKVRFGVHCCLDIETYDGETIKRLSRATDTIEEND